MLRLSHKLLTLQVTRRFCTVISDLQGTLHSRFHEHLRKNVTFKNDNLHRMIQLVKESPKLPSNHYAERCKMIERECLLSMTGIGKKDLCAVIDSLIDIMPQRILHSNFFRQGLDKLSHEFKKQPSRELFMKLIFYTGLMKKRSPGPENLKEILKLYLDKTIDRLNTIDIAIICTASYKASVRIQSDKFRKRLIQEITDMHPIDSTIYIAFIKSLRINEVSSSKVVESLKKQAEAKAFDGMQLQPLCHIFAFIADNGIMDEKLTEHFVERCIEVIVEDSRVKDIQKFLYSLALLNLTLKQSHLDKLETYLIAKLELKEFETYFDNFVDAILSLWMLNHKSQPLIEKLLKDKRFYKLGDHSRVKIDSRKKLLMTCIEIEKPEWLHEPVPLPSFDEERRAPHYLITDSLEMKMRQLRANNSKFVQQIRHLNLAGILVKNRDGYVHYEALDVLNSLSDKKSPNGILALKLRLLKHMNCEVVLVSFDQCFNGTRGFNFTFILIRRIWYHDDPSKSFTQCSTTLRIASAISLIVYGLLMGGTCMNRDR